MDRIRNIHHPFNYGFTSMFEDFPDEFVESLGAPGKFVKKANIRVKLPNGKTGEMDAPYVANPDGKTIFEKSLVLLEHQRFVVRHEKGFMISNYVIQGVADEKLPYYVVIASHHDADKHLQEFDRNGSFITRLIFIDLGELDNWQRLYNIRDKLKFNKCLSITDGLSLGIVVLFAPEDSAKERTREALHYLLESEISSKKLEFVLYGVFYCMIDAYFDDDEEFERMIDMLDEKVNDETTEKFNMQIRLENRLKYMQAEKDLIAAERDEISVEKDLIAAERDEISVEKDLIAAERDEISVEKDLIAAERDELSVEVDKAFDLIKILSKFVDSENEDIKKVLYPFREILKDSNMM